MNGKDRLMYWILLGVGCLVVLMGCQAETVEETAVSSPVEEAVVAPTEVVTVRDAVLDFLRDGANVCVPPEGVIWQTSTGGEQTPDGYELYRFTTGEECTITVSHQLASQSEPIYHVALGHGTTGFCWQALVDEKGHVIKTGVAANSDPDIGNPAQIYCEAQGYQYEVMTRPTGLQCGQCVFDDGSQCNGWSYLNDECQPGDSFPEEEG